MSENIKKLKDILAKYHIDNDDLIEEFISDAEDKDDVKIEAIDRFFKQANTDNPFDEGFSYYDLMQMYEDILDENA